MYHTLILISYFSIYISDYSKIVFSKSTVKNLMFIIFNEGHRNSLYAALLKAEGYSDKY